MALNQSDRTSEKRTQPRRWNPGLEALLALAATAFSALLLLLVALHSGPQWRDEMNTFNVAQMPTLHDFWHNLTFESFPPMWPLLLRGCMALGWVGSDLSVRLLGFGVGLLVLGSFWLCARWLGGRAPGLSMVLIGFLPAFVFIAGSNRAYGLATFLLVMSFGSLWRLVQAPSRGRILLAFATCLLFAHCVYYDVVFLAAMLAGGALVALRRRQWRTLGWLTIIGAVSAGSMVIYLPIIRAGSGFGRFLEWPDFQPWILWTRLGNALTAASSSAPKPNGPEIWLWMGLVAVGIVSAGLALQARPPETASALPPSSPMAGAEQTERAERALFCGTSMLLGVVLYLIFLCLLHFSTQRWYYVEMLCLCVLALDGLLAANWPGLRPWGWLRIVFMLAMMAWSVQGAWLEAHTRRSNVDLIAALLEKQAAPGDFIVVQSVWEGIPFCHYYHGPTPWETVPPVASHLVHRNDLVFNDAKDPNAMAPVLGQATNALQSGHAVWFLGNMWIGPYQTNQPLRFLTELNRWNTQISSALLQHAVRKQEIEVPSATPVCRLECMWLTRFDGYRAGYTNFVAH